MRRVAFTRVGRLIDVGRGFGTFALFLVLQPLFGGLFTVAVTLARGLAASVSWQYTETGSIALGLAVIWYVLQIFHAMPAALLFVVLLELLVPPGASQRSTWRFLVLAGFASGLIANSLGSLAIAAIEGVSDLLWSLSYSIDPDRRNDAPHSVTALILGFILLFMLPGGVCGSAVVLCVRRRIKA